MAWRCPRCGKVINQYRRADTLVLSMCGAQSVQRYKVCEPCAYKLSMRFYEECNAQELLEEERELQDAKARYAEQLRLGCDMVSQ